MNSNRDLLFMGIALKFSSLNDAPGLMPWSPNQLDEWAADLGRDKQAVHAVRYILEKWNPSFDWECGKFNAHTALECWDRSHRLIFLDQVTRHLDYSA